MKKHQVSDTKTLNEYNPNKNIDIIGIDEGKNMAEKDHNYLTNNKTSQELIFMGNHSIFNTSSSKINESFICSNCGETFDYMGALAQHYNMVHHKV